MTLLNWIQAVVFCILTRTALSLLHTGNTGSNTQQPAGGAVQSEIDIIRQLLNQETTFRIELEKNVHALLKDVASLKQDKLSSEQKITSLQKDKISYEHTIASLKQEIALIKNSSLQDKVDTLEHALANLNITCDSKLSKLGSIIEDVASLKHYKLFSEQAIASAQKDKISYEHTIASLKQEIASIKNSSLQDKISMERDLANLNITCDSKINKLGSIMENLKNAQQNCTNGADELKVQVRYLTLSLLDANKLNEDLNTTIHKQGQHLNRTTVELQTIQQEVSSIQSAVSLSQGNITSLFNKINSRKIVGFSSGMRSSKSWGSWSTDTLVFDNIIYSVGGGYNSKSGVFTSPISGVYVFYCSLQSELLTTIWAKLLLNGVSKVGIMAYNNENVRIHQAGSNQVVLHLNRDDRVWIEHYYGSGSYSIAPPVVTFSGFLISV